MDPRNVALVFLAMAITNWMTYKVGELRGKRLGYAKCVAEEDDDHPRDYATRPKPPPTR